MQNLTQWLMTVKRLKNFIQNSRWLTDLHQNITDAAYNALLGAQGACLVPLVILLKSNDVSMCNPR